MKTAHFFFIALLFFCVEITLKCMEKKVKNGCHEKSMNAEKKLRTEFDKALSKAKFNKTKRNRKRWCLLCK